MICVSLVGNGKEARVLVDHISNELNMSKLECKLTCNQSAILNNQNTARNLICNDFTFGSFFCASFFSPSLFESTLLYILSTAVAAPNITKAVLNVPVGVDVSVDNLDDRSDSMPVEAAAAAEAVAPPRGMVRCSFVADCLCN